MLRQGLAGSKKEAGMDGLLMRLGEVKRLTGLSKRSIYRLVDDGALDTVRPTGGQRMYVRSSVARWMECAKGRP